MIGLPALNVSPEIVCELRVVVGIQSSVMHLPAFPALGPEELHVVKVAPIALIRHVGLRRAKRGQGTACTEIPGAQMHMHTFLSFSLVLPLPRRIGSYNFSFRASMQLFIPVVPCLHGAIVAKEHRQEEVSAATANERT